MPCLAVSLPLLSQLITAAGGQTALGGIRQGPERQTLWQQQAPFPHPSFSPSLANLASFIFVAFHRAELRQLIAKKVKTSCQHEREEHPVSKYKSLLIQSLKESVLGLLLF